MIIYKATNEVNGKVYVGQTTQPLKNRMVAHISKSRCSNTCFAKAICKYGIDNFKWETLQICKDIDELNEREQYYILYYGSFGGGYNCNGGGRNYITSDITKEKLRQINLGRTVSEQTREKIRQGHLGKKLSEEHKKHIRDNHVGMLGKKHSKETIKKISGENNHSYGKHPSELTLEKNRTAQLGKNNSFYGKKHTPETLEKISKAISGSNHPNYGKKHSDETKEKLRQASLEYWKNKKKG